jgi:hypothetical protein
MGARGEGMGIWKKLIDEWVWGTKGILMSEKGKRCEMKKRLE